MLIVWYNNYNPEKNSKAV